MKKLFLATFLLLLTTTLLSQERTITLRFDIPGATLEKTGNGKVLVKIAGAKQLGVQGGPSLPFLPVSAVLPPGYEATDISFQGGDPVLIASDVAFAKQPAVRTVSGSLVKGNDAAFQTSEMPSQVSPASTGFLNGISIANAVFTPVNYDENDKSISLYKNVEINIKAKPSQRALTALGNLDRESAGSFRVMPSLRNKEALNQYSEPASRTAGYDMIIVTPEEFVPCFDTLIEFYKTRGFEVKAVSTEHIYSVATGQDRQEKIRDFIISEYQSSGIGFVLLGGDTNHVPSRGFYCIVQEPGGGYYPDDYNIPADLYYSALDGSWNNDGDSKWAEPGEEDLYPEVAVGRFPFSDTIELNNLLHKTMSYQSDPVVSDLEKPLLAGEHLYNPPQTWGADYMELLVGEQNINGYGTTGIPVQHDIDTLYERDSNWSSSDLMNAVNQGISALHHCGHANYTYVMKLSNSYITNSNFSQANGVDHNFPVVYTHGCMCGGFDKDDCIAERMVNIDNFASAFVGNSRYGWFVEGTSEGPAEHLHREFVDAVYNDTLYWIGEALKEAKIMTAPWVDLPDEYEPGAFRWNFYDLNILGDPLMAMWTWQPQPFEVSFDQIIPVGVDSLEVFITKNGMPLKNFRCAIMQEDSLFGYAQSDSTGRALVNMTSDLSIGDATLCISGYNILKTDFDIYVADYWLGYTDDWSQPSNWFSGTVPDQFTPVFIPSAPIGTRFPINNSGTVRNCKNLHLEQGAQFEVDEDETLIIWP
jgi:hypothetical protein